MRVRRWVGLGLATAALAGTSALGAAATAQAAPVPPVTVEECVAQGGVVTNVEPNRACEFPDGSVIGIDFVIYGDLLTP